MGIGFLYSLFTLIYRANFCKIFLIIGIKTLITIISDKNSEQGL